MKIRRYLMLCALVFGVAHLGHAQTAPAGSTGQCKDGSYTSASTKSGACRGHKGVQTWFAAGSPAAAAAPAAAKSAPAAPAAATAPAAPASALKPTPAVSTSNAAPAPGGGSGTVWVNTSTNVYHCSTDKYYGKTKQGKYMTEAQAKAAGAHPEHGKGCGQ